MKVVQWPPSQVRTWNELPRMGQARLAREKHQDLYAWYGPAVPEYVVVSANAKQTPADAAGIFRDIAEPLSAAGVAELLWDPEQELLTLLPSNEAAAPVSTRLPPWPSWDDMPSDFEAVVMLTVGRSQYRVGIPALAETPAGQT